MRNTKLLQVVVMLIVACGLLAMSFLLRRWQRKLNESTDSDEQRVITFRWQSLVFVILVITALAAGAWTTGHRVLAGLLIGPVIFFILYWIGLMLHLRRTQGNGAPILKLIYAGQVDEARDRLEALEQKVGRTAIVLNLWSVLYAEEKDYDSQIDVCNEQLDMPDERFIPMMKAITRYNRGHAYWKLGDMEQARPDIEAALEVMPNEPHMVVMGLKFYLEAGDIERAREMVPAYRSALKASGVVATSKDKLDEERADVDRLLRTNGLDG